MSNFRCLTVAIAISAFCCWSANVMAQFGGPQQMGPPAISPYVNMLRSDASPALNYYGLVRPQQQFAQQNQQLGQGLQSLQMQSMSMPMNSANYGYSQLGATGHPVIFNSFGTSRFSGGYTGFGGGGGGGFGGGGFGGGGFGGGGFGGGGFGGGGLGGGFGRWIRWWFQSGWRRFRRRRIRGRQPVWRTVEFWWDRNNRRWLWQRTFGFRGRVRTSVPIRGHW